MKYIGGREMPDCMDYCKSLEKEILTTKNMLALINATIDYEKNDDETKIRLLKLTLNKYYKELNYARSL